MDSDILISFIIATSVLAISPGPDNIYVLMQSLVHGKKFGIATVCGLMTGCLVHTTLVAFGVSALIRANDSLYFIIKLFGALYLLYLAFKVFRSDGELSTDNKNIPKKTTAQLFKQGFIMNVLNPKVSIFFLAFFPGFLFSKTMNTVAQFYILGLLFMLVSFVIFGSIAILSGMISDYIKKHHHVGLVLKWMQIVVFVGIAIFILLSGK
ncbi:MAG: LysE family translocator [Aquaticitalea sp.]